MVFGYEFVDLDHDQKHARRVLLEWYPLMAQLSALVVLALFVCGGILSFLARQGLDYERPRSPSFSKRAEGKSTWLKKSCQGSIKLSWWMKKPVAASWGTRGEWIGGGIWMAWLLYLSSAQTSNDYLHLTKRFGIIGASQLPLHYLLAMRSPYSPIQHLTRMSHEQLKASHQVLGRIIYFLFFLHATFYMNFFVLSGFLAKRIKDKDVIIGILSIILLTILSTTALEPLRRWNYRVFFTTHVIIASTILVPLYFHVTHIRKYVVETIVVYTIHQVFRNLGIRRYSGTIKLLPGTNLVQICIPLDTPEVAFGWKPGQHVYLSRPSGKSSAGSLYGQLLLCNQANPFTIASIPAKDGELLLVARALNGNTKHLEKLARSLSTHNGTHASIPLALEGPYGASTRLPDFSTFDKVLLVAGGVGATFLMPIYRSIVESPDAGHSSVSRTRFIWAVRKLAETQWAFPARDSDEPGFELPSHNSTIEVCVTQPSGPDLQASGSGDDIELAEDGQLLSMEEQMDKLGKGMTVKGGRPSMQAIVGETFSKGTRIAVLACGPKGLTEELRSVVGLWIGKGYDVYYHEESFGW
ncbi:uncharacterized protein BDR25DRAFT_276648 [Lindgomyces ingoldianus]|uniref:Uncharacterized protein n=1 Tax=Lindgomyces ingoldianus TaxID=673940 RepID=A0ACB6RCT0_9PLEO|nr:uncharacterized protein BDR25DRAFT_276648 [Lindgomyces ingoldianus]KAF2477001.1 hypothetical protein BDR25DRAFT_276648 [Lindgomyces ingoldianus]